MKKYLLALSFFAGTAHAKTISCKVKTFPSCGSGAIELSLDTENDTFKLLNGDIRCWSSDSLLSGILVERGEGVVGYNSTKYQLYATHRHNFSFEEGRQDKIRQLHIADIEYAPGIRDETKGAVYLKYVNFYDEHARPRNSSSYLSCADSKL